MKIITYSGKIHSAECTAVALLNAYYASKNINVYLSRMNNIEIVQNINNTTQNTNKITEILIGIGNKYEHPNKYDYHQSEFNEIWQPQSKNSLVLKYKKDDILLSCAGLIWKHYGSEIIEMYLSINSDKYSYDHTEETIQDIVDIVYFKNIVYLDAHANGISLTSKNLDIHKIIDGLNTNFTSETENEKFNRGVRLVGEILEIHFLDVIGKYFNYQKDLILVQQLINQQSNNTFLFINESIPTIFKCLDSLDSNYNFKFCIFHRQTEHIDEYTIKTRRLNNTKYIPVCPLIYLNTHTNKDILYIHKNGLIAKTKTFNSALTLIAESLSQQNTQNSQNSQNSHNTSQSLTITNEENAQTELKENNEQNDQDTDLNISKSRSFINLKEKLSEKPLLTGMALIGALTLGYFLVKKD